MKKISRVCNFLLELILVMAMSTYHIVRAYDPNPLQDFCVAIDDPKNMVHVNGNLCKDPGKVNADDFFFSGLEIPTRTDNVWGFNVTIVGSNNLPGLNTQGLSVARLDLAPKGVIPPYTTPGASEIVFVLEGTLKVGFVSSNQDGNRLFEKTLKKGDVFAFPMGLVHFQHNVERERAVALLAWGSQNKRCVNTPNILLGSSPRINPSVIAKSFQLDKDLIKHLQDNAWPIIGSTTSNT